MRLAARLFALTAVFSCLTSVAIAQDETLETSDATNTEESALADWDRLIYVPFKELQKVFDNQEASAVIPYAEYLEMLKAATKAAGTNASSPDAVIRESHFTGTVEKDVVRLSVDLQINVLREKGWARLPITFGNAAVGKVSTDDDTKTILRGVGKGKYELLLNGVGDHSVTIELLTSVVTSPEHRSFKLNCPTVGISDLTLTIPEADQSIEVSPLQVLLPTEGSDDKQTVVKASLGATNQFEVRWNPEAGSKPIMDLLSSATNQTAVRVEPGLIQTTTKISYEVLRGELTEVSVNVPADARIIDVVSSAGRIKSWKAVPSGDVQQQIGIELLTAATDRFDIEIQTERTPEGDTFQLVGKSEDGKLQGIHADGVVRESGKVTLSTDASLTTVVQSQSGVKRVNAGGKSAANIQAWEFSGTTGSLIVQTKPVEPRLLVDQASRIVFSDDELRLTTRLTYTVERAGVFQLNLTYPDSLTVDTVRADGMSEFNVDKDSGKLVLSLTQKRLGKINVDITGHQAFDAAGEGIETVIPTVSPEGVERETGRVTVYAPRFLDVATVDEKLTGLFPADDQPQQRAIGRAVQVSSWKYTQRPFTLSVKTTPRPAQISSSVATTVQVEPDVARVSSKLTFLIQNAGIDTYRVAVPEALADDIRFRSLNPQHTIQQRDKATEAEDGWITWTLILQDEVTGAVVIAANWDVPMESLDDEGEARSLKIDPVRILPPFTDEQADKRKATVTQTRGEIRLQRHESLSITAEGEGETLEKIDVRELELLPKDGYLAFRYFSQPASATISIRKHEIHEVVATVVNKAAIEVVTDKQALANYRCRLRIVSSERQRLLIQLPSDADLQAPLLNGARTTFEEASDIKGLEGWDGYFVNISRQGTSDQEFLLSFQFRAPITSADEFPYDGQGRKQILRLPMVGDDSGGTVIQEVRTAVWCPDDIAFVGEPRNWKLVGEQVWNLWNPMVCPAAPKEAAALNSWIGDNGGGEFAQQGTVNVYRALGRQPTINIVWWNRPFLVAIICGALVFVGFILRKTSWENRLTLVIVCCLGVALWSLKDSSETLQFVSAGALGLLAVAGIWLVGLFLGGSSTSESSGGSDPTPPDTVGLTSPPTPPPPVSSNAPETVTVAPTTASLSPATPSSPAGAVSPSPEVSQWMNDLMGGK